MAGTAGLGPAASAVTVPNAMMTASDASGFTVREVLVIPRVYAQVV